VKHFLIYLTLTLLICCTILPVLATQDPFEEVLTIRNGMSFTFHRIFAHVAQKEQLFNVKVTKTVFPDSVTLVWSRSHKKKQPHGTRILMNLKTSRVFNPRFKNDELTSTSDTAPWVSRQILKELRETGMARNFRVGGSGAINWKATHLKIKDKVVFPVYLNGKPTALHAFRVNKGLIIWNNLNNPLVLEYKPLGIPLLTSVTGWRLKAIKYKY
jgi:hypothetical protein